MNMPTTTAAIGAATTADLHAFQHAFGAYLRGQAPCPAGLPPARGQIYQDLVRTNIQGFVDACLPVCRSLLGATTWDALIWDFIATHPLASPWFRDIPAQFVTYLDSPGLLERQALPPWLAALAHYEWMELEVDTRDTRATENPRHALNPSLALVCYTWPVHRIGPDWAPPPGAPEQLTCLALYRDAQDEVRFTELSPWTFRLLGLMAEDGQTADRALTQLALEIHHPAPAELIRQGHTQLRELQQLGLLHGEPA